MACWARLRTGWTSRIEAGAPRAEPRQSLLAKAVLDQAQRGIEAAAPATAAMVKKRRREEVACIIMAIAAVAGAARSEEHTSELQSRGHLVCRLLLEKKKSANTQD